VVAWQCGAQQGRYGVGCSMVWVVRRGVDRYMSSDSATVGVLRGASPRLFLLPPPSMKVLEVAVERRYIETSSQIFLHAWSKPFMFKSRIGVRTDVDREMNGEEEYMSLPSPSF